MIPNAKPDKKEGISYMKRFTKNIGMLLLSIWLILYGLIALFSFSFKGLDVVMGILAIAAGILLLIGR
jgi:uncharacterized membrane protein HdeD (DUF308 family)